MADQKKETLDVVLCVRISQRDYDDLDSYAKVHGMEVAQWCRWMLKASKGDPLPIALSMGPEKKK